MTQLSKIGKLICLEGIEGAGKTTHTEFIVRYLKSAGKSVILTREPGGTPIAETIRTLLLQNATIENLDAKAELLLLFAARAQHIKQVILPALSAGQWVVCDRFTEATYAYQGGGRGLPEQFIQSLESYIQQDLKIDCVLLLDLPVSLALARIKARKQRCDRIETEAPIFFNRVRKAYLSRAEKYAERYQIINASLSQNNVQYHISQILNKLLT